MIEEFVGMIQDQTYGELIFILGLGGAVIASILVFVFYATRNKPNPNEE